jgi:ATP-dependent Lhr-like helicase
VVRHTLQRLAAQGRVLDGSSAPAGTETEWCDAEVAASDCDAARWPGCARRSSPVDPQALARFLPAWQSVADGNPTGRRGLRGVDGVLTAIDQLAGAPVPASALEQLVLAARVRDYEPAYLDELTTSGEVVWAGQGDLPGNDGWVALHLADQAPLTLPPPTPFEHSELHQAVLDALAPGGAWFFRQLSDQVAATDDRALAGVLWDLVWASRISNDTLTPLRALIRGGKTAHRTRQPPAARVRPCRAGPGCRRARPTRDGRALGDPAHPRRRPHPRAHAVAERLSTATAWSPVAVASERVPGGFAAVYKVLAGVRGDRTLRTRLLRRHPRRGPVRHVRLDRPAPDYAEVPDDAKPVAVALAATDPANPYGAALPWPDRPERPEGESSGHRPGRRPAPWSSSSTGALTLYVERGGEEPLPARRPGTAWSRPPTAPRRRRPPRSTGADHRGAGPTANSSSAPEPRRWRAALNAAGFRPPPLAGWRLRPSGGCVPEETPSGVPPGASTRDSRAGRSCAPTSGSRPSRPPISQVGRWSTRLARQAPADPHRPRPAMDPAHPPEDGGLWRVYAPASAGQARPHARVVLDTGEKVGRASSSGIVELVLRAHEDQVVGHLGPDLLGPTGTSRSRSVG